MEKFAILLFPALTATLLLRFFLIPMRTLLRIGLHSGSGLFCLFLLNTASAFTGIVFPINPITAVIAGFGGLPGIALMTLFTLMT